MTTSQKNQAIADKCPGRFKYTENLDWVENGWHFMRDGVWSPCLNGSIIDDLNAMAVAERALQGGNGWQLCSYSEHLKQATSSWDCFATANQRADAFGKVMGIWE